MSEIEREQQDLIYTDEQWDAIAARDRNILVSAAAGSGKTAVLVRRITRMLTEGETSVDRILVVTFTRAAASEMKAKIIRALTEAKVHDPGKSALLKKQLDNMYRAQISTFDSFALDIVHNYFHLIGIDANISVLDESDGVILKAEAMDETFERLFESDYEAMSDFLAAYSTYRNDDVIKRQIIKLYDDIRSIPDYMDWFRTQAGSLGGDCDDFLGSARFEAMRSTVLYELSKSRRFFIRAKEIADSYDLTEGFPFYDEDIAKIDSLAETAENSGYDEIRDAMLGYRPSKMAGPRQGHEHYDAYKAVKKQISSLRNSGKNIITKKIIPGYFSESLEASVMLMNRSADRALFLCKIMETFETVFREKKAERGTADFSDIMHYALEILKNDEVSAEFRNRFDYILIDEYQDTNRIQERLIDSIKRDDNVFMVGDIKQSIYRFRMADPAIFSEKYSAFEPYDREAVQNSAVIELNKNFRSKAGVIDSVNAIFTGMMDGYDDSVALHKGIDYSGDFEHKTEVYIINTSDPEDDEIDEELANMTDEEIEGYKVAQIISENVGKTMIHDTSTGEERPMRYGDIVILLRKMRSSGVFCQTIRDCGIELFFEGDSGYFDRIEIMSFVDLLRIIDNYKQDIPLLGVLRSHIFDFSIDELTKIRAEFPDVPYHEAFVKYPGCGSDRALAEKSSDAVERIAGWKAESRFMQMSDFIWKVLTESGYYTFVASMPGGTVRAAMLRAFAEKADHFSQRRGGGLYDLIRYIDDIREKNITVPQPSVLSENDDVVRVMTVHKSKGLEFPMVIYARTGQGSRGNRSNPPWAFHNKYGFGIRYSDVKNRWHKDTLGETVIRSAIAQEEMNEEKRLMYVAMTRAEDKLVITGTARKGTDGIERDAIKESTALSLIYPALKRDPGCFRIEMLSKNDVDISGAETQERVSAAKIFDDAKETRGSDDEIRMIDERLSYEYEYPEGESFKSKYSVTELNSPGEEHEVSLKVPSFRTGEKKMTAAEVGTAVHSVMQRIDFPEALRQVERGNEDFASYIESVTDSMVDREILTPEEKAAVDPEKIMPFFTSDIGRRAAGSDALFRERPVTARHTLTDEEGNPREVLIQGTIDCFFEENGDIVLLDYKTNRNTENIGDMYRTQIDLYAEALGAITGKRVKEAYLYLYSKGEFLSMI
ncbi:MAG: helicase-exonuclease AddAB subunit AddA [Anaerovoracaceae bacterium]|jgi:ATP-dependent helicase/nuclease subunit A